MKKSFLAQCLARGSATAAILGLSLTVTGAVIGSSTDNGDGTVTYSYLVDNSGGAFDIAAWALEFNFPTPDWDQLDQFSGGDVTVPDDGWFADAGIPTTGLSAQDFLALAPESDVLIGTQLGGFSFISSFQPGTVTYHEFSATAESASGTTVGPVASTTPVPESGGPCDLLALGALVAISAGARAKTRATL